MDEGFAEPEEVEEQEEQEGESSEEDGEEEEVNVVVVGEKTEVWREDGVLETTFTFWYEGESRSFTVGSSTPIPSNISYELMTFICEWGLYIP